MNEGGDRHSGEERWMSVGTDRGMRVGTDGQWGREMDEGGDRQTDSGEERWMRVGTDRQTVEKRDGWGWGRTEE